MNLMQMMPVISFTWTKPTFNIAVVPNQKVEFGMKGDGFKKVLPLTFLMI